MKRILLISPIPTHPTIAGNRTRIQRLLTSLREMGHEVHFLCVNTEPWKADETAMASWWGEHFHCVNYRHPSRSLRRYASRLRFLFEPGFTEILPVDYRYDESLNSVLADLSRKTTFDVVIVEYIFWSKALECFDETVLKIIDTHDVFTRRHLLYRSAKQEYGWYCTTAEEEAKGLNRADVIIAIQEQERQYFSTLVDKNIITVRHIAPLHKPLNIGTQEKSILFVASDAGTNVHGINYFLREVFPDIRSAFPEVKLHVVGSICRQLADNVEGCVKLGEVEDIAMQYEKATVVINPVQFSTGLSIKTMEGLGRSKVVVTTSAGSRGLEQGANSAFLLADSPKDFTKAVIKVLANPQLFENIALTAHQFVLKWNFESLKGLSRVLGHE